MWEVTIGISVGIQTRVIFIKNNFEKLSQSNSDKLTFFTEVTYNCCFHRYENLDHENDVGRGSLSNGDILVGTLLVASPSCT